MCAINPTHKKRFLLDVYTIVLMEDFNERTTEIVLEMERELNERYPMFRFHIKETDQEAD